MKITPRKYSDPATDPLESGVHLPPARTALLFAVMMVIAAGNTAMQSVMPSIGTHLGIADHWVSLAFSWSALLWMVMAPFWARRSDRRGRKAMMALGLMGFILSFALGGAALYLGLIGMIGGTVTILLFGLMRSFYGLFGSAAPPAVQAYVASRTSRAERTRALSLVASSFGLGTVLGPAVAPLLMVPPLGLIGPFAAFSLFALLVLIALRVYLPDDDPRFAARGEVMEAPFGPSSNPRIVEDDPDGSPDELPAAEPQQSGSDRLRLGDRRLRAWLVVGLIGANAQAMMVSVMGFLVLDRLGLRHTPDSAAGPIGIVLMCGAGATLLAQWGLIPTLHMGARASAQWGMGLCLGGTIMVALGTELHAITLGYSICSLGFGLFRPGFTSGASLAVSRAEQGQAAGIVTAVNGSAYIASPAIGVWLYDHSALLAWGVIESFAAIALIIAVIGLRQDTP